MRLWFTLGLAACAPVGSVDLLDDLGDGIVPSTEAPTDTVRPLTWHGQVRAIAETNCVSCHQEGGAAPFSMEHDPAAWASGAPAWARPAARTVADGSMPPWKPDPDCKPIMGERLLTDAEKETFAKWAAAGFPQGDPADYIAPELPVSPLDRASDVQLRMPVAFTPDRAEPDDYQCFVLDYDSTEDRWMTGFDILPDQRAMVHHVIVYQLDEEYTDDVAAWDAATPEPGYSCLFDPGTWDSRMLGGWAPGQQPVAYPEGIARHIPAGSKLVYQVHYNTAALPVGQAAPEDRSGVEMWFLPVGQTPDKELVSFPFPIDPVIPAGDPAAVAEDTISFSEYLYFVPEYLLSLFSDQVAIIGYYPHMHQLGTKLRFETIRDGVETCEISIDDWDFNWQQGYLLQPEDWYIPMTTDSVRLRCEYDNTAEHQPIINGVQHEPRDVYWGEGSFDEMCLVFLETTLPPGLIDLVY